MQALDDAIYDAMAANGALVGVVGSAQFYRGLGKSGAGTAFLQYAQIGGPGEISETPTDAFSARYLIKAVSEQSQAEAEQIGDLVRGVFHRATFSVSGWTNIWTVVEDHVPTVELDPSTGKISWSAGRVVEIRLSK